MLEKLAELLFVVVVVATVYFLCQRIKINYRLTVNALESRLRELLGIHSYVLVNQHVIYAAIPGTSTNSWIRLLHVSIIPCVDDGYMYKLFVLTNASDLGKYGIYITAVTFPNEVVDEHAVIIGWCKVLSY